MILGITGNRHGITDAQEATFLKWLKNSKVYELHHGDCVGADIEVVNVVCLTYPGIFIIAHPPIIQTLRAFHNSNKILPEKDYLVRNRDIVDASDIIIGFPDGPPKVRSGTWSTLRYAKTRGKSIIVIMPEGTENGF